MNPIKKLLLTINEKIRYCLRTKDLKLRMKSNQDMVDGFIEGFVNPRPGIDSYYWGELEKKVNQVRNDYNKMVSRRSTMKKYWILFSAMFSFLMFANDLHKLWLLLSEKEGMK